MDNHGNKWEEIYICRTAVMKMDKCIKKSGMCMKDADNACE